MSKIKVLLFDAGRIVGFSGGMEKVLFNMANSLDERGYDVTILAFENKPGEPFYRYNETVRFINAGLGVSINRFWINARTAFYRDKAKRHVKRLEMKSVIIGRKVSHVIQQIQPDVIIAFKKSDNYIVKETLGLDIPVIAMAHMHAERLFEDGWPQPNLALEKSECIQVLMPEDVEKVYTYIRPQKVVCIPNTVPQFDESADLALKTVIHVGRIDERQKRQHLLIEAFIRLKKEFPEEFTDWKLELWGEVTPQYQDYSRKLQEMISKSGCGDSIRLCGTTENVPEVLKKASVFVFPSSWEGFGIALAEAMSMGIPAIGYKNTPAVRNLIRDGANGILCDDGVGTLAEAMARLMRDYELRCRFGMQAKKDMERYRPEVVWDMWEKLIKQVM